MPTRQKLYETYLGSKGNMSDYLESILGKKLVRYLNSIHNTYLPQQLFKELADTDRFEAYQTALQSILKGRPSASILQPDRGSILLALEAVRLGAERVILCEQWSSLASLYEMIIADNKLEDRVVVLRQRLVETKPDHPAFKAPPSILLCHNLDSGLLGCGLRETLQHAWTHLLAPGALVIPQTATVYCCPIELSTEKLNGFDVSKFNRYRWSLFYDHLKLGEETYRELAEPKPFLNVDFTKIPSLTKQTIEFDCCTAGKLNALAFWFELSVDDQSSFSTAPPTSTRSSLHQAVQYLNPPIMTCAGSQLTVHAKFGPDGIRFWSDGAGDPPPLQRLRAMVPHWHFPMLADKLRNDSYEEAIIRAVKKKSGARVLDIGSGTGLLSMMAARAGAQHVTACERIYHMAEVARAHFRKNGFGDRIQLVAKDSKAMNVPDDIPEKANILISETVDHSLLGEGFLDSLVHARSALLEDDVTIIPASATVFAMGIQLRTEKEAGFDLSALNLFRYRHYHGIKLKECAHLPLTEPFEALTFNFYDKEFKSGLKHFQIPAIADGICNAIAFWYHLHLDAETLISTAPESNITAWDQAIIFLEQDFPIEKGQILPISAEYDLNMLQFYIDPLNFLLEGGTSKPPTFPAWFTELQEEEVEMRGYTEAIRAITKDEYPYITKATFEALIARRGLLGFDLTLFSDFITQVYSVAG